jgi:hypothetical protein
MRVRIKFLIALLLGIGGAVYAENLAAFYVAIVGIWVMYVVHAIEFKLNKLLDQNMISVPDFEIARDRGN